MGVGCGLEKAEDHGPNQLGSASLRPVLCPFSKPATVTGQQLTLQKEAPGNAVQAEGGLIGPDLPESCSRSLASSLLGQGMEEGGRI